MRHRLRRQIVLVGLLLLASAEPALALTATATWTNPTDPNRTGIRVERRDGPDSAPWVTQGPVLGPNSTTFSQTGLAVSQRYCFRVIPVGLAAEADPAGAPVACGTPDRPLNVNGLTIIFAP